MGKRIKGITIEIDGETKGLDKALKDVNKRSVGLQSELKDVNRLLKFDPGNVEALAQKQRILTEQVDATTDKLKKLKSAEKQVQKQFENGEIGIKQYQAFQREIQFTEGSLDKLRNSFQDMEKEQQKAQKSTKRLKKLFQLTGKSVDDFADDLDTRLVHAIKDGRASAKQLDTALDKIGKAALGSKTDISKLKTELDKLDDGKSAKNVRKQLKKISKQAQETEGDIKDLDLDMENVLGGAAAAGGISEAVSQSLDLAQLKAKIDVSFDVPDSSKKEILNAVRTVETYGVDAETALEGVRRQWALNQKASDSTNANIVKQAGVIASTYGDIDFTELIQENNEVASQIGISKKNALGLMNALLKAGLPPDELDIVAEYGGQLHRAGLSAEQIQSTFEAGIDTGTWNIDVLLDGLKEGRVRLTAFGQQIPKATKQILKGTNISAKQLKQWGQDVAKGGKVGHDAMIDVAMALSHVRDKTKRNALGVQIFGSKWEDQGGKIINTILGAQKHTSSLKKDQDKLNQSVDKMDASPAVEFSQAMQDLKKSLAPLLTVVAGIISHIAIWIQNNPALAATIVAISGILGILLGLFYALLPVILTIISLMGALEIEMGAIVAPVLIVIGIFAALIAIGVLLYKNWDKIKKMAVKIWGEISAFFKNITSKILNYIKTHFSGIYHAVSSYIHMAWNIIKSVWGYIKGTFKNALRFLKALVTGDFQGMKDAIHDQLHLAWKTITDIWGSVEDFFKDIDLWQIGQNIIQGLINGIKSIDLGGVIKSLANQIPDWIAKPLGIRSPSRVTMALGEYVGEGLAKGINNSINNIQSASSKMATAAIPQIDNTSSISASNNQTLQGSIASNQQFAQFEFYLDGKNIGRATAPIVHEQINKINLRAARMRGE